MPSPPRAPVTIDLGGCRVSLLRAGALSLDGGAMFGIIPKPLWAKSCPADERNRIRLACNALLVDWDGHGARRVIIETGHGTKYADKERDLYDLDTPHALPATLAAHAIDPVSITDVILSHLHFDHAGGLTCPVDPAAPWPARAGLSTADAAALTRPAFPRARVHVQRREFEDARANFGIMTMTYREENFAAIDRADLWQLLEGEGDILPGIRAWPTPGHTRGHHSIVIAGRQRELVFVGDVLPTRHHVGAPYNMGYDLLPLQNRDSKRALLTWAAQRDALLALDHDPDAPVVRVTADGGAFRLLPY